MLSFPPESGFDELILASGSRYRAELLGRLRLPFRPVAADIDESPLPEESTAALVRRLSREKALHLRRSHPIAAIVGSDQAASLGDEHLGKPGTRTRAIRQLERISGRTVSFHTGLALCLPDRILEAQDVTTVRVRTLSAAEIERYVDAEPAFDCAGSFKCEGLGIGLFDAIESRDPTALIGLPLIALSRLLREAGLAVP
ncbi:MAG: Maf family protein [Nevskiales bacterium]|nr:Maf family protein [Nevskiales bacterium]